MIQRTFRAAFEPGDNDDGLTISGYAVPFDVVAEVPPDPGETDPYLEVFRYGAFRDLTRAAHRIGFTYLHDDKPSALMGRVVDLGEDKRGLRTRFRCYDDPDGRKIATMAAAGDIELSISFVPGRTNEVRDRAGRLFRERLRVKLIDHIAAVPRGAYPLVEPLAVRHAPDRTSSVERWRNWRAGLTIGSDVRS